jgi:hypothetical protein
MMIFAAPALSLRRPARVVEASGRRTETSKKTTKKTT